MDDQERAMEAALARDLGRKCCPQRQFALAETYFERSLELYALPGVAKLRREARAMRADAERRAIASQAAARRRHTRNTHDDTARAKRETLVRLRTRT
jgi:hypothetical protein